MAGKGAVPGFESMTIKDYRDARARGMGGSATDPFAPARRRICWPTKAIRMTTENILIHEFAHNMHLRGLTNVDATFDRD
jgi:hypothetical protein